MESATMLKRMDEDNVLCVLTEPDCDGLMVLTDGIGADVLFFEQQPRFPSLSLRPSKGEAFDLRPSPFALRPSDSLLARSFARHTS